MMLESIDCSITIVTWVFYCVRNNCSKLSIVIVAGNKIGIKEMIYIANN